MITIRERAWTYKGKARRGWQADFPHPTTGKRLRVNVPEEIARPPDGKRAAQAWAEERRDALKADPGVTDAPPSDAKKVPRTIAEAVPLYLAASKVHDAPATTESKEIAMKHAIRWNGDGLLADQTPGSYVTFATWLTSHTKTKETATINQYASKLSGLLRFAADEHWIAAPVKHRKVKDRSVKDDDDKWLTATEADKLIATATPGLWRTLFTTAVDTGLRPGELLGLRRKNTVMENSPGNPHGMLHVRETYSGGRHGPPKSGKSRDVPLTARAHAALVAWMRMLPDDPDGPVFRDDSEVTGFIRLRTYNDELHKTCRKADVTDVSAHALRHTYGSALGDLGVQPLKIMHLMGHADLAETQRYLHDDRDYGSAIAALDARAAGKVAA